MIKAILITLSLTTTFLFFIYGYNCYYLLKHARRYRAPQSRRCRQLPTVAVHLPIYNEKYVVHRLVDACAKMADEYGRERVRIMLLDDSDDETAQVVTEVAQHYSAQGFKVSVIRRGDRQGFKAGALQNALKQTEDDYIAVFDADFIPPPNFLTGTIPYLAEDERLAVVQCRWGHVNRGYNFITKAVSIGMDAHFLIEQPGRRAADCFLNFNGSAGVIKRRALLEAGGWHSDTLAEDLDASYRMQMKGYRILFLRDLQAYGEITPTIPSFKRQQGRWACGSLQVAKKLLPDLFKSKTVELREKIQASIHLTYYAVHPMMFASFLLALSAALLNVDTLSIKLIQFPPSSRLDTSDPIGWLFRVLPEVIMDNSLWILLTLAISCCTVAAWIYYSVALRIQGLSLVKNLPSLLILGLIGYGISLNNTLEAFKAVFTNRRWVFKRTPKYAVKARSDSWRDKKYQVPLDTTSLMEITASLIGFTGIFVAAEASNWGIVPILALYTTAYTFVGVLTLVQSREEASA